MALILFAAVAGCVSVLAAFAPSCGLLMALLGASLGGSLAGLAAGLFLASRISDDEAEHASYWNKDLSGADQTSAAPRSAAACCRAVRAMRISTGAVRRWSG